MHKHLSVLTGCLLVAVSVAAQLNNKSLPVVSPEAAPNRWLIKFAPLSLLETDAGPNFSVEYIVPKLKMGFQLETQAVLYNALHFNGGHGLEAPVNTLQSGQPHGIKLRPEVRYYLHGTEPRTRYFNVLRRRYNVVSQSRTQSPVYLAADFLYKQVRRQRINEFAVFNGTSQAVFRQQAVYTDVRQVTGFDLKMGILGAMSGKHWFTDFYIGCGIRYKKFWYRNLPVGASAPARENILWSGENTNRSNTGGVYGSVPLGIKITYRL